MNELVTVRMSELVSLTDWVGGFERDPLMSFTSIMYCSIRLSCGCESHGSLHRLGLASAHVLL